MFDPIYGFTTFEVENYIMRAAIREKYGPPEELKVKIIKRPVPRDNELLVKIYATTVNRTDCAILTGKPYVMRLFTGLIKPKHIIPGTDFSGVVEAVGSKVSKFKPGDKIWGFNDNGLQSQAQYMTIGDNEPILHVPQNIGFEESAAAAEAAHYAYNFINKVHLRKGQKVMLNGATGAIGSAALQMIKLKDIYVAATCELGDEDLVKSLGADKVIVYTREDFTQDDEHYDFVFDTVGKSSFGKCKRILKPGGVYISSELGPRAENPFLALKGKFGGDKKVIFPVPKNIKGSLGFISGLLHQGKFKPLIDRKYPLKQIADAYEYVASGKKKGNVIIVYDDGN